MEASFDFSEADKVEKQEFIGSRRLQDIGAAEEISSLWMSLFLKSFLLVEGENCLEIFCGEFDSIGISVCVESKAQYDELAGTVLFCELSC